MKCIIRNADGTVRKCKNFKQAQEFLEVFYRFIFPDQGRFYDVVRKEYFPEGHKYAGKISGVFRAYGCQGWRTSIEFIN